MSSPSTHGAVRHRIVIVGGGFGGLLAARFLARKKVDVTVVDRRNHRRRSLRGEFRTFEPSSVRVILLDAGKQPLATFGDELSEAKRGA